MLKSVRLFLILAAIIVVVMYVFVPTKSKNKTGDSSDSISSEMKGITFDQWNHLVVDSMTELDQKQFQNLTKSIEHATDSLAKIKGYTGMIDFFKQKNHPEIAAYYVFEKANIIKNPNSWEICGDNFLGLYTMPNFNQKLAEAVSKKAIESFEHSISLDSSLKTAKMKLAQCYIELSKSPMQGVQLLLGIVKKNPKDIDANLLLARFGLVSGQYDKVMTRIENVLSIEPNNIDAHLMKVDAAMQMGKKELAATEMNQLISNPKIPKELKSQLKGALEEMKHQH
jgi:tetratricopeptide (TPR) repeat protein